MRALRAALAVLLAAPAIRRLAVDAQNAFVPAPRRPVDVLPVPRFPTRRLRVPVLSPP